MARCRLVIRTGTRVNWLTDTAGSSFSEVCDTSAKGSLSKGCKANARPASGLVTMAMSIMPRSSQSNSAGVNASRARNFTPLMAC